MTTTPDVIDYSNMSDISLDFGSNLRSVVGLGFGSGCSLGMSTLRSDVMLVALCCMV